MSLRRLPSRDFLPGITSTLWRLVAWFVFRLEKRCAPANFARAFWSRAGCLALAFLGVSVASTGFAQASLESYGVGKKRDFLQISASAPVSQAIPGDPNGPYHFAANLTGSSLNLINPVPKITLPGSSQYTLVGSSSSLGIVYNYTTKSALDAAFPNGSYSFTAGTSTLPISLGASDAYPAETPQVTTGAWDGQGRLVVNASSDATLNFNNFSQYSSGTGGIITFTLSPVSGTTLGGDLVAVESIALSGYSSDAALTAYTIPAGTLQANQTYYAELSFARIVNLNTTFLPIVGTATFMHTTGFVISTTVPAASPVITVQPAGQSVTVGANVVLNVTASGNPTPAYQWRKDGVNIGGATISSFTLNNVQLTDAGSYSVVASNSAGQATSDAAVLTVNTVTAAPAITLQPASQTVTAGGSVSFSVTATGSPAPTCQWRKNAVAISGATNATYTIASTAGGDAGTYSVVVTNSVGSATSNDATLTVNPSGIAPLFAIQPADHTFLAGDSIALTAAASGIPAPTYQWRKNDVAISGATNSSYTISSAVVSDAGSYTVIATNPVGSATSNTAVLSLMVAPNNAVVSISIE